MLLLRTLTGCHRFASMNAHEPRRVEMPGAENDRRTKIGFSVGGSSSYTEGVSSRRAASHRYLMLTASLHSSNTGHLHAYPQPSPSNRSNTPLSLWLVLLSSCASTHFIHRCRSQKSREGLRRRSRWYNKVCPSTSDRFTSSFSSVQSVPLQGTRPEGGRRQPEALVVQL